MIKPFFAMLLVFFAALVFFVIIIAMQESVSYGRACFADNCFYVEIPVTRETFLRGLMDREQLDVDKGMLFIFAKEEEHAFWMKHTLIPLDIIWINAEKEIVFISRNTQPCSSDDCPLISPGVNATYVMEINGGIADELGLRVGNKVTLVIP